MTEKQNKILTTAFLSGSAFCFVLGLLYPIMATKKQVLGLVLTFDEVRLIDSVRMFFDEGEWIMGSIILLFAILFPVWKYVETAGRILVPRRMPDRWGHALKYLDRWSMLDVFLVAVLILNANMDSSILVMKPKSGTTFLAIAVILRMLASDLWWAKWGKGATE